MFKKILVGLGIAAAVGLVFVLAPLAHRDQMSEESNEDWELGHRRQLTEAEMAELEED